MNYKELDYMQERAEDFMREEFTRVVNTLDHKAYKLGLAFDAEWNVTEFGVVIYARLYNEEGNEVAFEKHYFSIDEIDECLYINLPTVV